MGGDEERAVSQVDVEVDLGKSADLLRHDFAGNILEGIKQSTIVPYQLASSGDPDSGTSDKKQLSFEDIKEFFDPKHDSPVSDGNFGRFNFDIGDSRYRVSTRTEGNFTKRFYLLSLDRAYGKDDNQEPVRAEKLTIDTAEPDHIITYSDGPLFGSGHDLKEEVDETAVESARQMLVDLRSKLGITEPIVLI